MYRIKMQKKNNRSSEIINGILETNGFSITMGVAKDLI